jgi:hypothetical protein
MLRLGEEGNEDDDNCDTDNILDTTNHNITSVWKKLKEVTFDAYQIWLSDLNYEPYVYDSLLQSIS